MKSLFGLVALTFLNVLTPHANDASQPNDLKIAQVVRKAVRDADSTLLHTTVLGNWRDYLKIAAIDLEIELQPLVLIKFDEDMSFRTQLKKLIEWEATCKKVETEHYIYYHKWDAPLPELILDVQEVHFNAVTKLFNIELPEKIPYRYDVSLDAGEVYAFDDLRGGIVSPQPFDLEKAALAIFYSVNSGLPYLTAPLSLMYGRYFQNESTSRAHFEKCMHEITRQGYVPALELYRQESHDESSPQQGWLSAFAFVYKLTEQFGAPRIAEFLKTADNEMSPDAYSAAFERIFEVSLTEFEQANGFEQAANKL